MRMTILLIGLMIMLSACAARRVEVSVPGGDVVVDTPTRYQVQPRQFCPPGHRMKGWC